MFAPVASAATFASINFGGVEPFVTEYHRGRQTGEPGTDDDHIMTDFRIEREPAGAVRSTFHSGVMKPVSGAHGSTHMP